MISKNRGEIMTKKETMVIRFSIVFAGLILTVFVIKILNCQAFKNFNYFDVSVITYKERTYFLSKTDANSSKMKPLKKSVVDTKINVKGMEVYDEKHNPYDSTIILLKNKNGRFLVYSLSGGP